MDSANARKSFQHKIPLCQVSISGQIHLLAANWMPIKGIGSFLFIFTAFSGKECQQMVFSLFCSI